LADLIIDTDAGIDDLLAIAYLLTQSNINIQAFTVVNGLSHVEVGATNILRVQQLMGKTGIPVYIGPTEPMLGGTDFLDAWRKTTDELPGVDLPTVVAPAFGSAVDFLAEQFTSSSQVALLAIGPHTNLAYALEKTTTAVTGISQMTMMGGAVWVSGNVTGHGAPVAEWNIFEDPQAASLVFQSNLAIDLMVPLDASNHVPIGSTLLQAAGQQLTSDASKVIFQLLTLGFGSNCGDYFAWDPLAAVSLVNSSVITDKQTTGIEIVTQLPHVGRTKPVSSGGKSVTVATNASAAAFQDTFLGAFS
jgi:inosine-uridine nucleoside N-ribohydrolase